MWQENHHRVTQDSLTARAAVMDKANHTLLDSGGWGDWMAPNGNPDAQQLSLSLIHI